MVKMKVKCLAMLLMAVAIYLTLVFMNLDKMFFILFSPHLAGAVTVCVYVTAFGLLYVAYDNQFGKMSAARVLNIVALQSFIMFLWFAFVNLIQLYPFTVIETVYSDWYWPQDFFPVTDSIRYMPIVTAVLAVACFMVSWGYKRYKVIKQQ
jgi:hypothetical protein